MQEDYLLEIFKALAHPKRLKILQMLSHGSLCACNILEHFDFSQPALSQHMKVLIDCGLVKGIREGNWMHYYLMEDKVEETIQFMKHTFSVKNGGEYKNNCKKCEV